VVNLGYVVNVIEDAKERTETLREAFRLCRRLLIVSARLSFEARATRAEEFGDGLLTRRGTFQKFFAQDELRDWIDTILGARSVAAAPGIFIVFRDDTLRQAFQLARYRQRATAATERISDRLFEEHQDLLQPLMDFFAARGRLPEDEEIEEAGEIRSQFGSIRQAFLVVRHASGKQRWEEIQRERAEGFLVYLALERFGGRPRFSALPRELQLEA
jgi:DNA phosphorothioation-associated putative methyltransferase